MALNPGSDTLTRGKVTPSHAKREDLDPSRHQSQTVEIRAATARPPRARRLGVGLSPAGDTGREAVSSSSPRAPGSQPRPPSRPETHQHSAFTAPQITAATPRERPETTAAPRAGHCLETLSFRLLGRKATRVSSRSRPAPVTFDTTSIQTPPRLPERPLAAGGWRLPEGYTAGVQDRDSHPAGLWKGLEMTRRLVRQVLMEAL